jgi:hypothetical protein
MQFGLAQLVPVNWAKLFHKNGKKEITNYEEGGWKEKINSVYIPIMICGIVF